MRSPKQITLAVIVTLAVFMTFTSCGTKKTDIPTPEDTSVSQPEDTTPPVISEKPVTDRELDPEAAQRAAREKMRVQRLNFEDQLIHFDFDSWVILPPAMAILKSKAAFLNANPGLSIMIEGHCDVRGTSEYNMALGDRRAQSAKTVLVDLGVSASRIRTVSYGEEKPLRLGTTSDDHTVNRRCKFNLN